MTGLRDTLQPYVSDGSVAGAVGLLARGDRIDVQAVGALDADGTTPMARDSIFRIASLTKPVVAAAVLMLIEDGKLAYDDPIGTWLPELASPVVVRTPAAPVDDVVPAARPITVGDLLTSRAGYGFASDFSLPAVAPLFEDVQKDGLHPQHLSPPDVWLATLARIPLLYQPGETWLYNTSSDLQGVLIARVTGGTLPDFLAERLFEPLGMTDTGFVVPADKRNRFASYYRTGSEGGLELVDAPDGQWSRMPAFPSGAGGLVSTADDWLAFARLILAGGTAGSRRLLSADAVRRMTTNHLTEAQRETGALFLEGQGWGYGGSVDIARVDPWNVPGRYGWVGGTGTSAHLVPSTGSVALFLSQQEMAGPTTPPLLRDFWRYAAEAGADS
ncbi:serine hydrolase domain-containing protein [Streptomyces sp. NPDC091292]|uniref:serine hydrolase domain-containing protein n=1 Tax=Streptomyces sp. NPDC091292 TaxID=3365991 RepID=UPI00382D0283